MSQFCKSSQHSGLISSNAIPGSTSLPTEGCHSDQQDHYIPIQNHKKIYT